MFLFLSADDRTTDIIFINRNVGIFSQPASAELVELYATVNASRRMRCRAECY